MKTTHERQLELEADMVALGKQRYDKEKPMPWSEHETTSSRNDEADTQPGSAMIAGTGAEYLRAVEKMIKVSLAGSAARYSMAVQKLLHGIDPEAVALIALRRIITGAGKSENFGTLSTSIGSLLEEHAAITNMRAAEKDLANWWLRKAARTSNTSHARKVMRAATREQLAALAWSKADKVKVGARLIELCESDLGLIHTIELKKGRKTYRQIQFTEIARTWVDNMHEECSLLQPVRLPMLEEPLEWTTPWDGGYYTVETNLMKNAARAQLDDLASAKINTVYSAVNTLQGVAWTINKSVHEVMQALVMAPAGVACIPAAEPGPKPVRPAEIPMAPSSTLSKEHQKMLKSHNSNMHAYYNEEARRQSQRIAFKQKVYVAQRFADETFYFPYQIDTRGRIYTVPTEVSPQSDDLGKALLKFAKKKPLGDDGAFWLAVQLANSAGVDKVTFDARVQWVLDNEAMILEVGLNPLDSVHLWANDDIDSPWQFLAACFEWTGYVISGRSDDYESSLPVGMDGSCSGLQHFSAVLRDSVGGRAVNLVDTGKVEDIYTEVANRVNAYLDSSTCEEDLKIWRGKVDRKIVKQPCMTYAYSATVSGFISQIMKAIDGKSVDKRPGTDPYTSARLLAPLVLQCIEEVVVAAADAMGWMQQAAAIMTDHRKDLMWTAANGLPVRQSERKQEKARVHIWYCGTKYRPALRDDTEILNKARQKSAIAPNWIHSQDAAHLMAVANRGVECGLTDYAMIHDSFGVHACDVTTLNLIIRETFIEQYKPNRLEELKDSLQAQLPEGVELPPLPPTGTLDLNGVLSSEYFFA